MKSNQSVSALINIRVGHICIVGVVSLDSVGSAAVKIALINIQMVNSLEVQNASAAIAGFHVMPDSEVPERNALTVVKRHYGVIGFIDTKLNFGSVLGLDAQAADLRNNVLGPVPALADAEVVDGL